MPLALPSDLATHAKDTLGVFQHHTQRPGQVDKLPTFLYGYGGPSRRGTIILIYNIYGNMVYIGKKVLGKEGRRVEKGRNK